MYSFDVCLHIDIFTDLFIVPFAIVIVRRLEPIYVVNG